MQDQCSTPPKPYRGINLSNSPSPSLNPNSMLNPSISLVPSLSRVLSLGLGPYLDLPNLVLHLVSYLNVGPNLLPMVLAGLNLAHKEFHCLQHPTRNPGDKVEPWHRIKSLVSPAQSFLK